MRQIWIVLGLLATAVSLCAATTDPGLPSNYWQAPVATEGAPGHDWSELERDLRPEACAQCHREQFDDWKGSLHAKAFSPGLVGQFPSLGHAEANSCLKCHAPLAEQKYRDEIEMNTSLPLLIKEKLGFDTDAEMDAVKLPLRHSGVSCAACHVRGWQRFGPPSRESGAAGLQKGGAHGGFMATRDFEQSNFCASCHQFPDNMAINGKPLENTVNEWKKSRFAENGVTCQQCHMPDRKHYFKGIHDPEMVKKGLRFDLRQVGKQAQFSITSVWIGHAFPTYVTPRVEVVAEATNRTGSQLKRWRWEIVREVYYDHGWKERRDTRLMPGETRNFLTDEMPERATQLMITVRVIPDSFYQGVYDSFLTRETGRAEQELFIRAGAEAKKRGYLLYRKELLLQ